MSSAAVVVASTTGSRGGLQPFDAVCQQGPPRQLGKRFAGQARRTMRACSTIADALTPHLPAAMP
jgi:hypothetical protein